MVRNSPHSLDSLKITNKKQIAQSEAHGAHIPKVLGLRPGHARNSFFCTSFRV